MQLETLPLSTKTPQSSESAQFRSPRANSNQSPGIYTRAPGRPLVDHLQSSRHKSDYSTSSDDDLNSAELKLSIATGKLADSERSAQKISLKNSPATNSDASGGFVVMPKTKIIKTVQTMPSRRVNSYESDDSNDDWSVLARLYPVM